MMHMSDSCSFLDYYSEESSAQTRIRLTGSVSLKPKSTSRHLRRSRSGEILLKPLHKAEGLSAFSRQRTTSTSSLAAATITPNADDPPSPPSGRVERFTSAIRSGLRKNSILHTSAWSGSRARAATNVASDYTSFVRTDIRPPLSSSSSRPPTNQNTTLPHLSITSTLPSPPLTASVVVSSLPPDTRINPASISTDGAQHQFPLCAAGDIAATAVPGTFRPRKRSLSVGGEDACHDFFARQIEQYGLQSLLTSPVAVCYFMSSAISNYNPETLLFYLEAEHYRTANFASTDRRMRYAKGLYKAFISSRAPLEINISHAMRQRVSQTIRTDGAAIAALFKETQEHAYTLLEQDYSMFRQRPLFHRMMAELSSSPVPGCLISRKEAQTRHLHAVSSIYDALSSSYGMFALPPGKAKLIESEMPTFTKFADMDLTSTELKIALPAWLCRTTIRLVGMPLPTSPDQLRQLQRSGGESTSSQTTCTRLTTPASHMPSNSNCRTHATTLPLHLPLLRPQLPTVTSLPSEPLSGHAVHSIEVAVCSAASQSTATISATAAACIESTTSFNESNGKKASKQKSMQRLRFRFQPDASNDIADQKNGVARLENSAAPTQTKSRWGSLWSARRRKAT